MTPKKPVARLAATPIFWNCAKMTRVHPKKSTEVGRGVPGDLVPLSPHYFKTWKLRHGKGGGPRKTKRQRGWAPGPRGTVLTSSLTGTSFRSLRLRSSSLPSNLSRRFPPLLPALVMVTPAKRGPAQGLRPAGSLRSRSSAQRTRNQPKHLRPPPPQVRDLCCPSARRPHSDPRAQLPPVPPRRRPLPCPRHLPRPLIRTGPERPERPEHVPERPLAPRVAHCSLCSHRKCGGSRLRVPVDVKGHSGGHRPRQRQQAKGQGTTSQRSKLHPKLIS